jgi:effector-binding domain-containing protein
VQVEADGMTTMYEISTRTLVEQPAAVSSATLSIPEIGPWLEQTFGSIAGYLVQHDVAIAGPAFARYGMRDDDRFDVEAGFPTATPVAPQGDIAPGTLPGGPAAVTLHVGPYDQVGEAWEAIGAWVRDHDLEAAADPWEAYLNDPGEDQTTAQTEVILPYRPR